MYNSTRFEEMVESEERLANIMISEEEITEEHKNITFLSIKQLKQMRRKKVTVGRRLLYSSDKIKI